MKKLRAADSADAIVDGLRRRRAEVYVPSSLRPPSVLDLALPRRIKRIVHGRPVLARHGREEPGRDRPAGHLAQCDVGRRRADAPVET